MFVNVSSLCGKTFLFPSLMQFFHQMSNVCTINTFKSYATRFILMHFLVTLKSEPFNLDTCTFVCHIYFLLLHNSGKSVGICIKMFFFIKCNKCQVKNHKHIMIARKLAYYANALTVALYLLYSSKRRNSPDWYS